MRREIDDQQPPTGLEHAGRLADRARRILQIVQDLMHDDDVEGNGNGVETLEDDAENAADEATGDR